MLFRAATPVRLECAFGHERCELLIHKIAVRQTESINDRMLTRQTSEAPGTQRFVAAGAISHARRIFQNRFCKGTASLALNTDREIFVPSASARRPPTEKSHSSEANTNARSKIADAHESAICHGISAPRHIAPCWLQLHLSYLTGALLELLNGRVRGKFSSEDSHRHKNFVLVCPSVLTFAATPLESFSGTEAVLKT